MKEIKNLYFGIDLGTTNSVIGYGTIANNGQFKANILEVERKSETGGSTERRNTLPSVVFYSKDSKGIITPLVGDYAKGTYGKKFGSVCKSVKSNMGKKNSLNLNSEIEDTTAAQVSSRILTHMLNQAKKKLTLSESIKDVIITVPASFDGEQIADTLEAAKIAGIDVSNEHEELLCEPKAVIYNFKNMQEAGEIPDNIIDFSTEKNILVFDLGGGTLDVTIHKVNNKGDILNIEDLAISRYTQIGGDNFDELIANDIYSRFEEQNKIKVSQNRKEEVMCKIRKTAERIKIDFSEAYENAIEIGNELTDNHEFDIEEMDLYDMYSISDYYVRSDIEKIISPLMGHNLTLKDAQNIDNLSQKDINNIVYPILDVIAKAGSNINIDAVIINGGMTKFFPIRERIKNLLLLEPICINDPDLSVAKGAVYYHYCLHKYNIKKSENEKIEQSQNSRQQFNTSTIFNDDISIGIEGGSIFKILSSGTPIPYVSESITDKFILNNTTDTFALEIFLGRGKDKNLPNRRIATNIVKLNKKYQKGTRIIIRFSINAIKKISFEVWADDAGIFREAESIITEFTGNKTDKKHSRLRIIGRCQMNPKNELDNLKRLSQMINKKQKKGDFKKLKEKIENRMEYIIKADNPKDFYEIVINELASIKTNDYFRGYLFKLSIYFAKEWEREQINEILKQCKSHFSEILGYAKPNNYVLVEALKFIEMYDDNGKDFAKRIRQEKDKVYKIDSFIAER